jgi:hypothetical protein
MYNLCPSPNNIGFGAWYLLVVRLKCILFIYFNVIDLDVRPQYYKVVVGLVFERDYM